MFWPHNQYFNWHLMVLLFLKIPRLRSRNTSPSLYIISTSGCETWPNTHSPWPAPSLRTEGALFCLNLLSSLSKGAALPHRPCSYLVSAYKKTIIAIFGCLGSIWLLAQQLNFCRTGCISAYWQGWQIKIQDAQLNLNFNNCWNN